MGKKRKEMNKSQPHPRVYSITRTTSTIFQIGKNTKMVEKREKEKRKRKKKKGEKKLPRGYTKYVLFCTNTYLVPTA